MDLPVSRRTLLLGLGGTALGAAIAGCSSGSSDSAPATTDPAATPTGAPTTTPAATAAASTSTAAPTTSLAVPTAYDPAVSLWKQGNYAAVPDEIESLDLEVRGALPPELDGLYVRNGSNPKDPSVDVHWFVGDGMLHGVRLSGGRATWYRNRWVQTPVLGVDPFSAGAPGGANNTSNTSVATFAGRLLSMEEVGFPFEISPEDLSTVGPFDFGGRLNSAMTAHPKIDPGTGRLHFFGYGILEPPYLTYHVAEPDGTLSLSTEIEIPASTMIHDFAITDRDVVFWDLPVLFSMDAAVAGSSMPFVWQPQNGARVGVMPLGGTGGQIRWTEIDPCYVYHGTNAWREGDDVVLDVSRQPDAFSARDERQFVPGRVERWRIGTAGTDLTFSTEVVLDRPFDLPTVSPTTIGRPHERAYYVNARGVGDGFEFGGIATMERVSGTVREWDPGFGFSAGEPLVVDEWVLTFVYDRAADTSVLAVFEADAVDAGPVAEVVLPRRVPFGFHGAWVPTAAR